MARLKKDFLYLCSFNQFPLRMHCDLQQLQLLASGSRILLEIMSLGPKDFVRLAVVELVSSYS